MQSLLMMNAGLIVIIGAVLISTNSIAVQCYNDNSIYKANRATNYNWIVINLVAAILVVLYGLYQAYIAYTTS